MKNKLSKSAIVALCMLAGIIIIIVIAGIRIGIFFVPSKNKTESIAPEDLVRENEDYFTVQHVTHPDDYVDDGVTTILVLGDDSFAAERGADGVAALVSEYANATIYNCSFEGTSIAGETKDLNYDEYPLESFSLYRILTCIQANDYFLLDFTMSEKMEEVPDYYADTVELLKSIDFDTIDIVILSYGINDYLNGHITTDIYDEESVGSVFGALTRSVRMIKELFPHVKIIINSPAYAYYEDEDGTWIGGDIQRTGVQTNCNLGDFMINMKNVAVNENVTFIDNYLGVDIDITNADQYLTDSPINLNAAGRELVAQHIADVLNNRLY